LAETSTPTCGAQTRAEDRHPCRNARGFRTAHLGSGHCFLHGGRTPNGAKHAAAEAAERAVAKLGLPVGAGDPFALLSKAVQHAEGFLESTSSTLLAAAEATSEQPAKLELVAAAELYEQAIRTAARTGKAAVDADVADRLAALDERAASLLMQFVRELFDLVVPAKRRPEIEAWASGRLAELGAEYSHAVIH
jgi:hypothetical protein